MAVDERRRQKKLEKKTAKRKAVVAAKKKAGTFGSRALMERDVTHAASFPIYECLVPKMIFDLGVGNVVLARELPQGRVGASFFLVDVFCLGVKDAFFSIFSRSEYLARLGKMSSHESLEKIEPACARKLIEGAVAYALDLGFKPHPDYVLARRLFGDLKSDACDVHYTYGHEGKPEYISGPYESKQKSRHIIDQLTKRCGPDGFHFTILGGL